MIEDTRGLFLIDSGSPNQQTVVLRKMQAIGRQDLKLIWITHAHYDHYGSAAALRELTGASIGIHPGDARSVLRGKSLLGTAHGRGKILRITQGLLYRIQPLPKTQVDYELSDGETLEKFGLNARILHTPGHTPGHTCIILENGTAFAADLLARNPRPRLQDLLATDWDMLPASLARLQAARPEWIYTGHSRQPLSRGQLLQIKPRR